MKKSIFLLSFVLTLLFSFCKKKEATPGQSSHATTTTGNTDFIFSDLNTLYTITDYNNTISTDSSVTAQFYPGQSSSGPPNNITAGIVSLNTFTLDPQPDNSYSITYPNPINISGALNWNVAGSGTITAFNYTCNAFNPKYTGGNLLPDTCTKASGISITINGVSNYTTAASNSGLTVHLIQNSIISKPVFGTSGGVVNFTPAELSGFTLNSSITIMVSIYNFNPVLINGIKRNFNGGLVYQKISYLK